jgi:hypothetical protein
VNVDVGEGVIVGVGVMVGVMVAVGGTGVRVGVRVAVAVGSGLRAPQPVSSRLSSNNTENIVLLFIISSSKLTCDKPIIDDQQKNINRG